MYQPSNRILENVLFALLLAALVAWTAAGVGAELSTVPSDRASIRA